MGYDGTQKAICDFCQEEFVHGSWQIGISDFASETLNCEFCHKTVCQKCSFSWGHEIDVVKKICNECMLRYEFRKEIHTPETIKRFRFLINQGIEDYICPRCSKTHFILDVFRTFMWCYRCESYVCPRCANVTYTSMAGHCKACNQMIKDEQAAVEKACIDATTNCERCGNSVRGICIGANQYASGTTVCTFCQIRVCPACLVSLKKGRSVIPACPECAKKSPLRPAVIKNFR